MAATICNVLVVDDSEDDRILLRRLLNRYEQFRLVAEAENGEQAVQYLLGVNGFSDRQKYPFPDLMLLDLKMPRKNGYEVLQWLQTQSFDKLKVVILSGSVLQEDRDHCLEMGADAFETKSALAHRQDELMSKLKALTGV